MPHSLESTTCSLCRFIRYPQNSSVCVLCTHWECTANWSYSFGNQLISESVIVTPPSVTEASF
jgi:hypothetical protein